MEPWGTVLVHAALVVVLVAAIHLSAVVGDHVGGKTANDHLHLMRRAEQETLAAAVTVQREMSQLLDGPSAAVPHVPHDAQAAIQAEVEALYRALASSQWPAAVLGAPIEFQVTFMTRCEEDDNITIAAWANRAARRPVSLQQQGFRPDIYEDSVTAEVYRETRPKPRLVESTTKAGHEYRELYCDQKSWIRSTIVYPVLNRSMDLVGTLVTSCDEDGFFRDSDYGFWCELLEPFAERIALEKGRLQCTVMLTRDGEVASRPIPAPF